MSKNSAVQEMFADIPAGLRSMFTAKLGDFSTLSTPTTLEEANITAGQFCAEVNNNLLVPLSGLPVVAALMYIGSMNPFVVSSVFSGLEGFETSGPIDVIAPRDGGVYPGYFDEWIALADVDELTGSIDGDEFTFSRNDNTWKASHAVAIGEHTATITDGASVETVSFSVVSWTTSVEEGGTYTQDDLDIVSIEAGESELTGGEVTLTDSEGFSYTALLQYADGFWFSPLVDVWDLETPVSTGAASVRYAVLDALGKSIDIVINFIVEGGAA